MKILFLLLILAAVAFEVVADFILKKWSIESKNALLFAGLLVYFIGTIFWAFSLRFEFLSKAVSVFTVLNFIAVVLVGVLFFNENLSLLNKLGVCLGVLSIILVEI